MVKQGDIYITKLERGFYGAIRIVKTGKINWIGEVDVALLYITPYCGTEKPKLSDRSLLKPLINERSHYLSIINIYTRESIEKTCEYLGNIPIRGRELDMKCEVRNGSDDINQFGYGEHLSSVVTGYAFREWRWQNEREEYIKELEEAERRSEEYRKLSQKPKKMLAEDEFWGVLSLVDLENDNIDNALSFMKKQKVAFIKMFEETLSYKLYLLDTKDHAIACGLYNDDCMSADGFLYTRCFAVALGEEYYNKTIENPQNMTCDGEFEDLLYLASMAYEARTKKEFEYETGCDYESFSNIDGWEEQ